MDAQLASMSNSSTPLSREEFEHLSVPQKIDHLYDITLPVIEAYSYVLVAKKFGTGLAAIVIFVSGIGSAIFWFFGFIKDHIH